MKGDKLVCKKNYSWHPSRGVMFTKGKIYTMDPLSISPGYTIIANDGIPFTFSNVYKYFHKLSDVRKEKLKKLSGRNL